jgi:histone H3/H4
MAPPTSSAGNKRPAPTGTSVLPQSRIKKIASLNPSVHAISAPATLLLSLATEKFIAHLASASHEISRASGPKPSRQKTLGGSDATAGPAKEAGGKTLKYNDVALAVQRRWELEFLQDVVPKSMTAGEVRRKKAAGEIPSKDWAMPKETVAEEVHVKSPDGKKKGKEAQKFDANGVPIAKMPLFLADESEEGSGNGNGNGAHDEDHEMGDGSEDEMAGAYNTITKLGEK